SSSASRRPIRSSTGAGSSRCSRSWRRAMWRKSPTEAASRWGLLLGFALAGAAAAGCRQDMHDQPKLKPLRGSPFFAAGRGSRSRGEGPVARGQLGADRVLHEGHASKDEPATAGEDDLVDYLPFPATPTVLARGRERFDIFCSPCHARTGEGDGMIV